MRVRNIEVTFRITGSYVSQVFVDWYDFADWLKQRELAKEIVALKSWRYIDRRM